MDNLLPIVVSSVASALLSAAMTAGFAVVAMKIQLAKIETIITAGVNFRLLKLEEAVQRLERKIYHED